MSGTDRNTGRNSQTILVKPETVRDFMALNNRIYFEANKRYSDEHLVRRFLEEICAMAEVARKDEISQISSQSARIFSWWCAVGNRYKLDLQEALWHKCPGVCPRCLRTKNCFCGVEHPDVLNIEQSLRRLRMERAPEPKTLYQHQLFHKALYGEQNKRILMVQTVLHLIEEAGEVSEEERHGNIKGMCDEMADVASWLFAITNRKDINLPEVIWNQYPYACERCDQEVCIDKGSSPSEKSH